MRIYLRENVDDDFEMYFDTLQYYNGDEFTERVVVPNGVKDIGECAFSDCPNVKEIVLPQGLEGIFSFAFQDCYSLEELIIPSTVEFINDCAFENCESLKKVEIIGNRNITIGNDIFSGCPKDVVLIYKGHKITQFDLDHAFDVEESLEQDEYCKWIKLASVIKYNEENEECREKGVLPDWKIADAQDFGF